MGWGHKHTNLNKIDIQSHANIRYSLDIMKVGLGNKNCVPFLCSLVQDFNNPSTSDLKPPIPSIEYLQNRNNNFFKIL